MNEPSLKTSKWTSRARYLWEKGKLPRPTDERITIIMRGTKLAWTQHALACIERHTEQPAIVYLVPEGELYQYVGEQWLANPRLDADTLLAPLTYSFPMKLMAPLPGVDSLNQALSEVTDSFFVVLEDAVTVGPHWLTNLLWPFFDNSTVMGSAPLTNLTTQTPNFETMAQLVAYQNQLGIEQCGSWEFTPRLTWPCVVLRRSVLDVIGGVNSEIADKRQGISDWLGRAEAAQGKFVICHDSYALVLVKGPERFTIEVDQHQKQQPPAYVPLSASIQTSEMKQTPIALDVVLFSGGEQWSDLKRRWIELLPVNGKRYVVGRQTTGTESFTPMSLEQLEQLDPSKTLVFVSDPLWGAMVKKFGPRIWLQLLPARLGEQDDLFYKKCYDFAAHQATLILTTSEQAYLEQTFRRDGVFFLNGEDEAAYDMAIYERETFFLKDYEVVFVEVIRDLVEGESPTESVQKQWRLRRRHYLNLLKKMGEQETVLFLLAVYHYFLEYSEEAERYLLQSYQLAEAAGHANARQTHYRFRSAIQAQRGELDEAVATFGESMNKELEQRAYQALVDRLQRGERSLAKVELFALNDDLKMATRMLQEMSGRESRDVLYRLYVKLGRFDQAVQLVAKDELSAPEQQAEYETLLGWSKMMEGDHQGAIQHFLQAAEHDEGVLKQINLLQSAEQRIQELLREEDLDREEGSKGS
ncbi:hypothetical protein BEP19_09540 [Ammoniphilus oxalaticus]|uniref:Tetratricopeptide repeat protein n=1 Tax=Ammoniphilus oxalaticus TaxID=66863 RepID=A0A419SKY0_9BACL|nr:hypothetical protein [Ammoniphilus oxalaticus]RKD24609.1 hypothetical protein BEP19_09540 [Ammoniphilus oxalaticus]